MSEDWTKCVVRDGNFVDACSGLRNVTDHYGAYGRGKGIARWEYSNMQTGKPTRAFYGVRSKEHPAGMLFNFCPFCGEKIDAPFNRDAENNHE